MPKIKRKQKNAGCDSVFIFERELKNQQLTKTEDFILPNYWLIFPLVAITWFYKIARTVTHFPTGVGKFAYWGK